jgi:pre-mRNA-processing factor 19
LFDVLTGQRALQFDAHQGGVAAVAFSENGYSVATGTHTHARTLSTHIYTNHNNDVAGAGDASVKLWDLRKQLCVHTLRLEKGFGVRALAWDHSGSYLALGGADLRVFAGKTLSHVKTFTDHAAPITGVAFGGDAKWLVSASADNTVRFWQ